MEPSSRIVDVAESDFQRDVVERSRSVPVVVDFWAPWCGPCKTLGPLLERLAEEHAGAFVLAKVDVDRAQTLASRLGVRSIPTVLGFRDGAIRAEFVGAQPEPAVREFLQAVLPSEADRWTDTAQERFAAGDATGAEDAWREALALEPRHGRALLGLARALAARGEVATALDRLDHILPHEVVYEEAGQFAAELRLASESDADPDSLRAKLAADPDDLPARIELGRALAAAGRHEEALETLLEAVRRDPEFEEGAARKAMLDLFEVLGGEHEATQRFRRELSRVLFA